MEPKGTDITNLLILSSSIHLCIEESRSTTSHKNAYVAQQGFHFGQSYMLWNWDFLIFQSESGRTVLFISYKLQFSLA